MRTEGFVGNKARTVGTAAILGVAVSPNFGGFLTIPKLVLPVIVPQNGLIRTNGNTDHRNHVSSHLIPALVILEPIYLTEHIMKDGILWHRHKEGLVGLGLALLTGTSRRRWRPC